MADWSGYLKGLMIIALIGLALIVGGCEGTDTREQADDTVKEMAGKKDVDRYKQMKKDLNDIQTQQAEKYHQLDDNNDTR